MKNENNHASYLVVFAIAAKIIATQRFDDAPDFCHLKKNARDVIKKKKKNISDNGTELNITTPQNKLLKKPVNTALIIF